MREKVSAIIQARTKSSRLPRKVLADLGGRPLLEFLIERVRRSSILDSIILATTDDSSDDELIDLARRLDIRFARGSEKDVLSRYLKASKQTEANILVRITGDCPLLDPNLITVTVKEFINKNCDYISNCYPPTFPDGLDIEVFNKQSLYLANKYSIKDSEREHVTPWIRNNENLKIECLKNPVDYSSSRWTVDEPEDLKVISNVVNFFQSKSTFSWKDVIELEKNNPDLFILNKKFKRNEGSKMNSGQKLWRRAKRVIPGGNMLLSKRPDMFLPEVWPSYFSKAKGCKVWDLDGNVFKDMSIMGIGTNTLGYGHPLVDIAACEAINMGNMSTLNCPDEVFLAEKLIELHPWAEMVRFARTGGEANAIAIRIARAATARDDVAICGYHGWHDWYLATNLKNDSELKDHLLPGLIPNGVPKCLKGTVHPFKYNDLEEIKNICKKHKLAAIKMEVQRSIAPEEGFLEGIKKLCNKEGIVLIFDECTSGFRETYGGLHLKYSINPDMAIFGKALGNGYAITSIIGKKNIMEAAQTTFISSTFWTERIGPKAALKTLEIMKEEKSWETITNAGLRIKKGWDNLASSYDLKIKHTGIASLAGFTFCSPNNVKYKTFITQEMLKKGYLASTNCYTCINHTESIIDEYLDNLDPIFLMISKCENGKEIDELLYTPLCHNGFERLN